MSRLFYLVPLVIAAVAPIACVQNEPSDIRFFPDKEEFISGGVSAMMESRCAGLDCHGQVGRPLRLYSGRGLRLATPEQDLRDNRPTTPEERLENYQSVIGVDPEGLSDTVESGGVYVDNQLIKKPLDDSSVGVRHKGGQIMQPNDNDPAYRCLIGWLSGRPDRAACTEATF